MGSIRKVWFSNKQAITANPIFTSFLIMLLLAGSKPFSVSICVAFEDLLLSIASYVMNIKNSRNMHLPMSSLLAWGSSSIFPSCPVNYISCSTIKNKRIFSELLSPHEGSIPKSLLAEMRKENVECDSVWLKSHFNKPASKYHSSIKNITANAIH